VVRAVNAGSSDAATLCINCGSSSIKLALFAERRGDDGRAREERLGDGAVEGVGQLAGRAWVRAGEKRHELPSASRDFTGALALALELSERLAGGAPLLVGHRVVHGGARHSAPTLVNDSLLRDLEGVVAIAPLHLPVAIAGMRAAATRWPGVAQVACFDTAFHASMPEIAWRLPLPDALVGDQVRRYGFHGLSYEYVMSVIGQSPPPRVVIAHLGNGASLVAVKDGRAIDTTMGFTPTGGIMMGTRTGDLDPGTLIFLARKYDLSPDALEGVCEREAGLLAVGGRADMRALLERSRADPRAALAVAMFGYGVRKAIGALAAALGGLDLLVFTGGIGEHAAEVRGEACRGLEALGVELDPGANADGAESISRPSSPCLVRIIPTDEDVVIARHSRRVARGLP
jgi:acetate kinase